MSITAKAAVSDAKGSFTIEEVTVHPPERGEVLVKIMASGVCHTDWDTLNRDHSFILGHEGAGFVEAIGEGVDNVKIGDKVLINWAIPCKECFQCQHGNHSICEVNNEVTAPGYLGAARTGSTTWKGNPITRSFHIGTMSTHTVVKKEALIPFTTEIPFSSACIIGCGVMTGYGSAVNAAKVTPGSSAVILGTGGVGLSSIQGCRISGAAKIIALDVNPDRLKMAQQFGATHTILASRDDAGLIKASQEVKKLTGGRGADFAFECTGVPALGSAPLAMVRNAGTAVQVSGIEQTIDFDMNLFEWDKLYLNPLYGKAKPEYDFPKILELYSQGSLLLDEMITRTYPLERLQDALDDMMDGRNAKGVLLFDEQTP